MSHTPKLTDDIEKLAQLAKAMSHPVRLYILKKISKNDTCCYSSSIAEELGIGKSALSQHLKELKHAGLINAHIKKPYIKYCINAENWNTAKKLMNDFFNE